MPATGASSALLLLLLLVATTEATILNITNRCSYTVWPATLPVGGGARELESGQVWTLDVPTGITGCLWARTGCWFSSNGKGSCKTGDCGGEFACNISGKPPYTVAEIETAAAKLDDISLVQRLQCTHGNPCRCRCKEESAARDCGARPTSVTVPRGDEGARGLQQHARNWLQQLPTQASLADVLNAYSRLSE
ncbi:hypothetical protein QYE76_023363 [Lolium multiflorum]|uniref:Uncharacterized protein n=1 Tax=Lolium multiflorum TaxID=4521 RepID=A0AAD8RC05_LOLMU|nr:hypothetical protein QYE76_023363 [Lolium multiflorum]